MKSLRETPNYSTLHGLLTTSIAIAKNAYFDTKKKNPAPEHTTSFAHSINKLLIFHASLPYSLSS